MISASFVTSLGTKAEQMYLYSSFTALKISLIEFALKQNVRTAKKDDYIPEGSRSTSNVQEKLVAHGDEGRFSVVRIISGLAQHLLSSAKQSLRETRLPNLLARKQRKPQRFNIRNSSVQTLETG